MSLASTATPSTQKLKSKLKRALRQSRCTSLWHHRVCGNCSSSYSGPLLAAKEVAKSF